LRCHSKARCELICPAINTPEEPYGRLEDERQSAGETAWVAGRALVEYLKEGRLPIVRGNCRKDGDLASERKRAGMTHDNKQDSGNAQ